MLKRFVVLGLMAGAMGLYSTKAEAAFITGQLDFFTTSFAVNNATGTSVSKDQANAIDFATLFTGLTPTPGTAGNFLVGGATGSFLTAGIVPGTTTGTIQDFSFSGSGNGNYPVPPISGFQLIGSPSFSFSMSSLIVTTQTSSNLSVTGFGTLTLSADAG